MAAPLQQQVLKIWQQQSKTQRVVLVALLVAALVLIPTFILWASTPTYVVAFSGMNETDAGQIVQKLDESKISYQLRDASTILVPSDKVYEVRLQMARDGLPSSGTVGFELFSGNTLGMTDFTQKVNYQRALEGELERTIGSMGSIESVRVHLVTPEKTLLQGDQSPTTASVTIKEKPGQNVDAAQVNSITRLVASSVEGLQPDGVVVVDTNGNLLSAGSLNGESASGLAQNDSRRAAEQAAVNEIQKKVQGLLDSVLGPNHSVVKASVAMDWTQREVTSQAVNPTQAVIISSQKSNEAYTTNGGSVGGIPGAGSNLPTPMPTTQAGGGVTNYQRTDETLNYEVSKIESHEVNAPGQIQSISLSVLVDGKTDAAQLKTLKSAVAAAAGINETRGDKLVVENMAFDRTYVTAQADEMKKSEQTDLYIKLGIGAAVALVVFLLLWYIMRLFRNLRLATSDSWTMVMKPVTELSAPSPVSSFPSAFSGGLSSSALPAESAEPQSSKEPQKPAEYTHRAPVVYPEDEQRQRVISRLTEENPASVAEIIQLWLTEDDK